MTGTEIYNQALYRLRDETGISDDRALPESRALVLLNEAINEACRRSRLLTDRTTVAICQIAVVAGTASYSVDPRIIKIRNARLVTAGLDLRRVYVADKDACSPGWEDHDAGTPYEYVADYESGKICLYRTPVANDTLKLAVSRLPITPLTSLSGTPEINVRFHNALIPYLVYRVRSIDDSEVYDPKKAMSALAEFEAEFGPKRSAWAEMYEDTQPYPGDE